MVSRVEIKKRKVRVRNKLKKSSSDRMRLSVFRSSKHIYAQVIDDVSGNTLVSCSTLDKEVKAKIASGRTCEASTLVGFHFSLPGHSLQHMQCIAIEQIKSKDPYVILARESFWIRKYQAISHGLNSHQ